MKAQFAISIAVGLAISAVLFLPLVLWQYRRFGRFDALRILWTSAAFIYAAGLIAFTIFPLPDFSDGYCAARRAAPLWDPLRFPRAALDVIQSEGLLALLGSWVLWEVALNVVLFIPFGLIVRRLLEWPRASVLCAGIGTSVLIELTQMTGNWGLAPCSYRFADTTDLITNSTGALIGIALEASTPRLLSRKEHLLAQRDRAHPVTVLRRLLGMMFDAWYLTMAALAGGTTASVAFTLNAGTTYDGMTETQMFALEHAIFTGAWLGTLLIVLGPALVGTGASLGQRTVYLRPTALDKFRCHCAIRAVSVQCTVLTLIYAGFPTALLGILFASISAIWIIFDSRGLSYRIAGLGIGDARGALTSSRHAERAR